MRTPRWAHLLSLFLLGTLTTIGCNDPAGPDTGEVRITLTVTGVDPDPDGYVVTMDGGSPASFSSPGSVTLDVEPGEHTFELGALAPNCAPTGPAAQSITVNPGEIADISFDIRCTAITGIVEVTIVTTGPDPDADGYEIRLDDGPAMAVLSTSLTLLTLVPAGSHSLSLTGSAPNCSIVAPNPLEVTVEVGGLVRDTARVFLGVTCSATTGAVRITATSTGHSLDPSYLVWFGVGAPITLPEGASVVFAGLAPGSRSIFLGGVASNCGVSDSNPATVDVVVGDTIDVEFNVTCIFSGVRIFVTTTGEDADDAYTFMLCGDNYCYDLTWIGSVSANGTFVIELPIYQGTLANTYYYHIYNVTGNCGGPTSGSLVVSGVTTLQLGFVCVAAGTVGVEAPASGLDGDDN